MNAHLQRTAHTLFRWIVQHPAVVFLAWALILSFWYFGLGSASYVRIHDNGDSILSARIMLAQLINQGNLGLWNPLIASGNDLLSSAHLQWSTLLFVLLPDWLAYGLLMLLQRFMAGYFMFRLLRGSLNLDVPVAFFGGLAFASINNPQSPGPGFAGFTIYDELALPAFPLVAWLLWYSSMQSTRRAYIIAACTGIGQDNRI